MAFCQSIVIPPSTILFSSYNNISANFGLISTTTNRPDGTAIVLVPLIQARSPEEAEVIERNIGSFGTEAQPLVDGVGAVFEALAKFVVVSGIDCELLTMKVLCEMSQSPNVAGGITTSPNVAGELDMPSPTPPDSTFNPTMIVGGVDVPPVSCGSAWDSGLPGKTLMDDPPQALFGGLYQPNSDVDHMLVTLLDVPSPP